MTTSGDRPRADYRRDLLEPRCGTDPALPQDVRDFFLHREASLALGLALGILAQEAANQRPQRSFVPLVDTFRTAATAQVPSRVGVDHDDLVDVMIEHVSYLTGGGETNEARRVRLSQWFLVTPRPVVLYAVGQGAVRAGCASGDHMQNAWEAAASG